MTARRLVTNISVTVEI